jgi:hypothetical protein
MLASHPGQNGKRKMRIVGDFDWIRVKMALSHRVIETRQAFSSLGCLHRCSAGQEQVDPREYPSRRGWSPSLGAIRQLVVLQAVWWEERVVQRKDGERAVDEVDGVEQVMGHKMSQVCPWVEERGSWETYVGWVDEAVGGVD